MRVPPSDMQRLAVAIERHYRLCVVELLRLAEGTDTANWRLRTQTGEFFVKQYSEGAKLAHEAAALKLSQAVRASGLPTPFILPASDGSLSCLEDGHCFALFEWVPQATVGKALNRQQMRRMGETLGLLHARLKPMETPFGDVADAWLALDVDAKRTALRRRIASIEARPIQDAFDHRTRSLLERRVELLPFITRLLGSLPALSRQVLHGDYSVWNVLFRGDELVAVVDFGAPERFLPAFEIGRAALNPETLAAGVWLQSSIAFVESYCAANPQIGLDDIRYAPHVWLCQLARSEYGVRQHYDAPLERQADLDRFWFHRCEAVETILRALDALSELFAAAWERRRR